MDTADPGASFVDLYWLPVAAGTISPLRRWSLNLWEAVEAARARRPRARLCHSALKVGLVTGPRYTLELTPVFPHDAPPPNMTGPVGFRGADRFRFLRYQMRVREEDALPDEQWTISSVRLCEDDATAARILRKATEIPRRTWGRRAKGTTEMWTSDSAISWLLLAAGIDASRIALPAGGRAPGWKAGIEASGWAATNRNAIAVR